MIGGPLPPCDASGLLFGAEDPVGASHASVEQARWVVELSRVLPLGAAGVVRASIEDAGAQSALRAREGIDGAYSAFGRTDGAVGLTASAALQALAGVAPPMDATSLCSLALALGRAGLKDEIGQVVEAADGRGSPQLCTSNGTA